jgi:hypothetical protein
MKRSNLCPRAGTEFALFKPMARGEKNADRNEERRVKMDEIASNHEPLRLNPLKEETAEARREPENEPEANLARITDTASLSSLLPRLRGLLEAVDQRENGAIQSLGDNILRLQDAFVEALYNDLATEKIDLSKKMTLRLDGEEKLFVASEHPDKEKVETVLADRPDFSVAFKEIAAQSALLRDVNNIGRALGRRGDGLGAYQNTWIPPAEVGYQLSLKGEMSHFYFGRETVEKPEKGANPWAR